MSRVKRGVTSHSKHKKLLKGNKGFRGTKSRLVKVAREAALHAGEYAFAGRKNKKRDFRRLWITRINEASKKEGMSYNKFIAGLKKANISVNRKILANLIVNDESAFKVIVDKVRKSI